MFSTGKVLQDLCWITQVIIVIGKIYLGTNHSNRQVIVDQAIDM